jgi:hypothetical protein
MTALEARRSLLKAGILTGDPTMVGVALGDGTAGTLRDRLRDVLNRTIVVNFEVELDRMELLVLQLGTRNYG